MKMLIYMMMLFMTLGCQGQQKKNEVMDSKKSDKEIVQQSQLLKMSDSVMMKKGKLDLITLKEKGVPTSSSTPTDDGWKSSIAYSYEENLPSGINISLSGNEVSGYSKTVKKQNTDFELYCEYYPSGETKQLGKLYSNEFTTGIWYWFSETGEIEKYEDYDAPYNFSWEDVQMFLKKHKVMREDINQIGRSDSEDVPKWYISFKTKELENTDNVQQYILNGTTGEILKKELLDISRELD